MENKDVKNEESKVTEEVEEKNEKAESSKSNKIKEELEKANADCEHWKNEYYRAYADMANLRKEIERDHKEAIKYRLEDFVQEILGVLDAFDMAFRVKPASQETQNYLKGFEYVYKQLLSVLENEGIHEIAPKIGDQFDEKVMHAVDTVEDEGDENIVKEVTLKGYKLHDHLVRAAMVTVSKHPCSKDVKEEQESKDEKLA